MNTFLTFLSLICLVAAVLLALIILIVQRRSKILGLVEIKRNDSYVFWEKLYFVLMRFLLTRRALNSIVQKLNLIGDFGVTQSRIKSAQLFVLTYIPLVILGVVLGFFVKSPYVILLIVIAFASVSNTIIDYYINKIIAKLLEQLVDFNEELRKKYLNSMMIDEAFYSVIEELQVSKYKEIIKEANKIYDILTSSNGEYKLNQYYLSAPNKYLKLLAGICFITREYGDSQVDGGSLLVRSITQISNELRNDILFRNRLNVGIKSLNAIVFLPIFFIHPLRSWASGNFFPMAKFYDGPLGFIAQMFVFTVVLLSFQVLKRLQKYAEESKDVGFSDLYKNIYKKNKRFVNAFIPRERSVYYNRKKSLLEKAMVFERIEYHYTKKLVFAAVFSVLSLVFILLYLQINLAQIYNSPVVDRSFLGGELKGKALERGIKLRDLDNEVMQKVGDFKNLNSDDITTAQITDLQIIKGILDENFDFQSDDMEYHAKRIEEKYMRLQKSHFSIIHVLIIYLFILLGYFLPDLNLLILHGLIKIDIVSEVVKFQIVVSILIHVKNMDVESLLEWLERFSYIYRKPIQKALMEYDSGAVQALERLKNSSDYYEFQNLVQHLISCVEELSLTEAFGEFEDEKQYYAQKRFDENEKVVEYKINIGKMFGFLPIYTLIVVYFIIPLIYVSVNELKTYFLLLK